MESAGSNEGKQPGSIGSARGAFGVASSRLSFASARADASASATRFFLLFVSVGFIWIFFSDRVVAGLRLPAVIESWVQTGKGLAFILVLGLILRQTVRSHVERVQQALDTYSEAKRELMGRLARAAEFRDDSSGRHNYRIGRYAQMLSREMNLTEEHCDLIFYAAALHDIGKIGIRDAVLLKEGSLTEEEYVEVQRHVQFGADLLAGGTHPMVQMAHAIALTHHENWDGSGYPKGLSEHDIPLEGRIVAVCDVFDALMSERPYKRAWSLDQAKEEIVALSGSKFDPLVVSAFLRCLPQLESVRSESLSEPWARFRTDGKATGILPPTGRI